MPIRPVFNRMPEYGIISPGTRETFTENGLVVFRSAYSTREISQLRKRIEQMVRNYQPDPADAADPGPRLRASASDTSFFLAADAFDADGKLTCSKMRAICEIGHAMHDQDPVFSSFFRREQLLTMAFMLGIKKPRLIRSRCIFNRTLNGSQPAPEQDAAVLYTDPEATLCFWIVMADSKPDQGCLLVAAKQHQSPLRRRLREVNGSLQTDELDATPLPECTTRLMLDAGSLVITHGRLPYLYARNNSSFTCLAVAVQVIDGDSSYPADNWLQRPAEQPVQGFTPDLDKFPQLAPSDKKRRR